MQSMTEILQETSPITPEYLKEKVQSIPLLPATVREVMEILESDSVDFALLEASLGKDPPLVMRVLSVANSPFYGFCGKIDSLHQACLILGLHTTHHIVMGVGIMEIFHAERGKHLDLVTLWQHSAAVGAAARVLADAVKIDPDKTFTSGLLHDTGKMVLDIYFTEDYAPVLAYQKAAGCLLQEAETKVLGLDHSVVGGVVAERWKLPRPVIDAIAGHHSAFKPDCSLMAALIHLANYLVHRLKITDGDDSGVPDLQPEALLWLGLAPADLGRLLPLIEEMARTATVSVT